MASARRAYVPVDTTTTLTKRRRRSAFNTCLHSTIDRWNDVFSFSPCSRRRHSFHSHSRNLGQKVHFHPHSTSSRYSSGTISTHRHSFSSTTPLKPILKSSAAYRHSLQASRTSNSNQTSRDSRISGTTSKHSTSRSTSRQSHRSCSSLPDSAQAALEDAQAVTHTLITMASLSHRLSTFRSHLSHLSHRLTILNEAECEQVEAHQRQFQLQTKYLDALSRQTEAMNELARGVSFEVTAMLAVRGDYEGDSLVDSEDEDVESFLGRKIAFEADSETLGRDIKVMDVDMRHSSVRDELQVLGAQMSLETLDRAKLFRGFIKMSSDIKDEINDLVDERDTLAKVVRRSGGRQELKDMKSLEENLTLVRRQYIEKNKRISNAYLAMNEKDIFKR